MSLLKKLGLTTIANGVADELFERELQAVAKNIDDQNTSPDAERKITLTVTLKPDLERREVKATVQVTAKLAPVKPASATVFCGKVDGRPTLLGRDPNQLEMELESRTEGVAHVVRREGRA